MITDSDGDSYEDATAHALDVKSDLSSSDISSMTHDKPDVPLSGKNAPEPQRTVNATIEHFKNSAMQGPELVRDFMEGRTSSSDPNVAGRALGVASQAMTGAMPFATKGAAGIFGGRLSSQSIAVAETMDKKGFPLHEIKDVTGLERGAEGIWRREFDDSSAKISLPTEKRKEAPPSWLEVSNSVGDQKLQRGEYRLGDILKHDELYNSYPELKKLPVKVKVVGAGRTAYAHIESGNEGADFIALDHRMNTDSIKATLLHEVQHIIQGRSGFSLGNYERLPLEEQDAIRGHLLKTYAPNDIKEIFEQADLGRRENKPHEVELARQRAQDLLSQSDYLMYRAEAHEQEAWNVARRLSMTRRERSQSLGKDTETIRREDQINYVHKPM